jgi:hypothetical protein
MPRCVQTEPRTPLTIQHVSTYSLTQRPLWLDVSDLCWESSILGGCPITDYSPQVLFWEMRLGPPSPALPDAGRLPGTYQRRWLAHASQKAVSGGRHSRGLATMRPCGLPDPSVYGE